MNATFAKRTEYALIALIALADQQERGCDRATVRDISAQHGVPEHFLENQMTVLRRAGLVRAHRGHAGGSTLARPAEAITVLEVVEAMEGPIGALADAGAGAERLELRAIQAVAAQAQEGVSVALRGVTLADLARRARHPNGCGLELQG